MGFEEFQAGLERQRLAAEAAQVRRDAAQAETARLLEARKNGRQFDPKEQPTIVGLNIAKRAEEASERQRLEAERIAAISPRDIWLSSLSWQEQQRVQKWEAANPGLKFPMPVGMEQQILASKGV